MEYERHHLKQPPQSIHLRPRLPAWVLIGEEEKQIHTGGQFGPTSANVFHGTLFQVFLDMKKANEFLDITRCMEVLRG